jgi:hypothetical protein
MGKVRRIISLVRRKEFFIGVGATFTAILALASAILTVIGQHFELAGTILFLAAALCLSCIWHYRRLNVPQVAVDDVIASGVFEYPQTRLRCPCDSSLAEEAKRLAAQCYAGTITIDPIVYEQFRAKNPLILGCLTDSRGEFLGYFDALPLKDHLLSCFCEGLRRRLRSDTRMCFERTKLHPASTCLFVALLFEIRIRTRAEEMRACLRGRYLNTWTPIIVRHALWCLRSRPPVQEMICWRGLDLI